VLIPARSVARPAARPSVWQRLSGFALALSVVCSGVSKTRLQTARRPGRLPPSPGRGRCSRLVAGNAVKTPSYRMAFFPLTWKFV
jgi:hypothetical protein